jgi:hypothetical protein
MTLQYNISNNNGQNKSVYKYMNLKQKLLLCIARIYFNSPYVNIGQCRENSR